MQFVLLIYQGTTPLPNTDVWSALPKDEQRLIDADYAALNDTPGLSVAATRAPRRRQDGARRRRSSCRERGPVLGTEGAVGGYAVFEADDIQAAIDLASRVPRRGTAARWRCALSARTGDRRVAEMFRSGAAPSDLA